jgi:tRNA threonylcarbamoyladenosine biosynthesis protein TsaB
MASILHIETSTQACSVGISINGEIIAIRELNADGFQHAELVTVYVEEVLRELVLNINEIDAVAVTSGPGSYTGLRIGVATAKGLCYACDIPLISVDALTSLAWQVLPDSADRFVCAAIDARRMEIYSAIFDASGKMVKPISADVVDMNSYASFEPLLIVGDAHEKLQQVWKDRSTVYINKDVFASVRGQARLAYEKYLAKSFEDVAYFEPFYLKEFYSPKNELR